MLVLVVSMQLIAPERSAELMSKEEGPVEHATVWVLLPGFLAGLLSLRYRRHLPSQWLLPWILVCTVGVLYFGGEEASWGSITSGGRPPNN